MAGNIRHQKYDTDASEQMELVANGGGLSFEVSDAEEHLPKGECPFFSPRCLPDVCYTSPQHPHALASLQRNGTTQRFTLCAQW